MTADDMEALAHAGKEFALGLRRLETDLMPTEPRNGRWLKCVAGLVHKVCTRIADRADAMRRAP